MNFLLIAIGSAGDVHPFTGLGRTLKERGHKVALATAPYFRGLVEAAGLEFIGLEALNEAEMLKDPNLWHPIRGFETVMRLGVLPLVKPVYELVTQRSRQEPTTVVGATLALGARVAQDRHGIPLASVHLQPAVFRSLYEGPYIRPVNFSARIPRTLKRFLYWFMDWGVADRVLGPEVNRVRAAVGLPPTSRLLNWLHSPQLVLGLFPDWYAPRQPDWPANTELTGFPLFDERDISAMPLELEQSLDGSQRPIVFTPGSFMVHGQAFFRAAIDACTRLNKPGVLLTRFPEQIPRPLPTNVRHFDFVPFSRLLPRSAALVHHGGIGTLSQGFAAGIPQIVMPMSHDQPDNALRLARLGVGDYLYPRQFDGARLAERLNRLLTSTDVTARCREVAQRIRGTDGLAAAADVVERFATRSTQSKESPGHPVAAR